MRSQSTRLIVAFATLAFAASPYAANAEISIADIALDANASYGMICRAFAPDEEDHVRELIAEVDDIRELLNMADDGEFYIERLSVFDTGSGETIDIVEGSLGGDPGAQGSKCNGPIRDIGVWSNDADDSYGFLRGGVWEVRYFPGCRAYPCNRYAKGVAGPSMTEVPLMYPPGGWGVTATEVFTDFYWRSGHYGSLHYWTTQMAWSVNTWMVKLHSGDSSINYVHRSCIPLDDYNSLCIDWDKRHDDPNSCDRL